MDLGLQGKRALVTGSTAGIGLAAAHALAREGALVIVNGRTTARVAHAVERIQHAIPDARVDGIAADLATRTGCDALIARQPELDVLVNNLGIFEPKRFEQISDEDWLRFFETNVQAVCDDRGNCGNDRLLVQRGGLGYDRRCAARRRWRRTFDRLTGWGCICHARLTL
jgi:NAD(P)-dependent dehydrogenase (short-subunit alcohol dehydrogenase family)